MGPAGIDKAIALAWLCDRLGIDRADVVAFGDEYNDHEMLRWAGRSVAMANAGDATRALCDETTSSNADDEPSNRSTSSATNTIGSCTTRSISVVAASTA